MPHLFYRTSYHEKPVSLSFQDGQTLRQIFSECLKEEGSIENRALGAISGHRAVSLNHIPRDGESIQRIDLHTTTGQKIYMTSLAFLYLAAQRALFPDRVSVIEHVIGDAIYTETVSGKPFGYREVEAIEEKMREMVRLRLPFEEFQADEKELLALFASSGREDKIALYRASDPRWMHAYRAGNYVDTFDSVLVPDAGFVPLFSLKYYYPGILISFPSPTKNFAIDTKTEHPKLAKVFADATKAADILGVGYVGDLNAILAEGKARELILVCEAFLENRIASIASKIQEDGAKRIVLVSGPSSSGKTTFAQKLKVQLKIDGIDTIEVSTDDYFIDREHTPKKEDGSYDFETIRAVDTDALNRDILSLIEGDVVRRRRFDFIDGKPIFTDEALHLKPKDIIIIEGIHALNPELSEQIPDRNKFKIYLSALTTVNIDHSNRVSTTDARFLRRMVRDARTRGRDVLTSLAEWKNVREGENIYVFPYQEEADVMLDTSMDYELAVLKKHAMPLLEQVPPENPHYIRATRLKELLGYFRSIDDDALVPSTSLLTEFIGGSIFDREIEPGKL